MSITPMTKRKSYFNSLHKTFSNKISHRKQKAPLAEQLDNLIVNLVFTYGPFKGERFAREYWDGSYRLRAVYLSETLSKVMRVIDAKRPLTLGLQYDSKKLEDAYKKLTIFDYKLMTTMSYETTEVYRWSETKGFARYRLKDSFRYRLLYLLDEDRLAKELFFDQCNFLAEDYLQNRNVESLRKLFSKLLDLPPLTEDSEEVLQSRIYLEDSAQELFVLALLEGINV